MVYASPIKRPLLSGMQVSMIISHIPNTVHIGRRQVNKAFKRSISF